MHQVALEGHRTEVDGRTNCWGSDSLLQGWVRVWCWSLRIASNSPKEEMVGSLIRTFEERGWWWPAASLALSEDDVRGGGDELPYPADRRRWIDEQLRRLPATHDRLRRAVA